MSRKDAIARYDAALERDRLRAAAYRQRAKQTGRPNPAAVDRAIVEALQRVMVQAVAGAGSDRASIEEALRRPISLREVGGLAVEVLYKRKHADKAEAIKMVRRRLFPTRTTSRARSAASSEEVTGALGAVSDENAPGITA